MNTYLETIGSITIGAMIFLMVITFNLTMNDSAREILLNTVTQFDVTQTNEVLEHDFYKIGFKVSSNDKIKIAAEDEIYFYTDLDNNNKVDSIRYFVGQKKLLESTSNPNDRPLYRKVNSANAEMIGAVTDFTLSYYDSTGATISLGNLASQTVRNKVRSIEYFVKVEFPEKKDGIYQSSEIFRRILLKNTL